MIFENVYFITGTAYAGKSTMVKLLAEKYNGIACEENYHDVLLPELDAKEFPYVTYTRDLQDWHEFIRRSPEEQTDVDVYKNTTTGNASYLSLSKARLVPSGDVDAKLQKHLESAKENEKKVSKV